MKCNSEWDLMVNCIKVKAHFHSYISYKPLTSPNLKTDFLHMPQQTFLSMLNNIAVFSSRLFMYLIITLFCKYLLYIYWMTRSEAHRRDEESIIHHDEITSTIVSSDLVIYYHTQSWSEEYKCFLCSPESKVDHWCLRD